MQGGIHMKASSTLAALCQRSSTRKFTENVVSDAQREAVLHAALRAPSAGAMMMYSVIDIQNKATIEKLSVLADNQSFIAKAPWALIFVADYCKWIDLFKHNHCFEIEDISHERTKPGFAELMLAVQDTMLAAGNAMTAAEAVGLGSCFIGDVLENAEEIRELLDLPEHTLPLSMLVIGEPIKKRPQTPHPVSNLVMHEKYCRATPEMLVAQTSEMGAMFCPHSPDSGARIRDLYTRKHTSDFMYEMERSIRVWFDNWCGNL